MFATNAVVLLLLVTASCGALCGVNFSVAGPAIDVSVLPLDEFNVELYMGWAPHETLLTLSYGAALPRLQVQATMGSDAPEPLPSDFAIGLGFSSNSQTAAPTWLVSGPALGRATIPPSILLPVGEWSLVALYVNFSGTSVTFAQPRVLLPSNITVLPVDIASSNTSGFARFGDAAAPRTIGTPARPWCVVVQQPIESFSVEVVDSSLHRLYTAPVDAVCVASVSTATGPLSVGGVWAIPVRRGSSVSCVFSDLLVLQFGVGAVLTVTVSLTNNTSDSFSHNRSTLGSVSMPLVITRLPSPRCYLGFTFGSPSWLVKSSLNETQSLLSQLPAALVHGAILPKIVVGLFGSDHRKSSSTGLVATARWYFQNGTFSPDAIAVASVTCGLAVFDTIQMPVLSADAPAGSAVRLLFSVSIAPGMGTSLTLVSRQVMVAAGSQGASSSLAFAVFDATNLIFTREGAPAVVDHLFEIPSIRIFAVAASGTRSILGGGSAALRLQAPAMPVVSSCSFILGVCTFSKVRLPSAGIFVVTVQTSAGVFLPSLFTGHVQQTKREGAVAAAFAPWGSLFNRELQPSHAISSFPLPPIRLLLLDRFGAVFRGENQILVRASSLDGVLASAVAAAIGGEVVFPGLSVLSCNGLCSIDFTIDALNVTLTTGSISLMDIADADVVASVEFADSGLSFLKPAAISAALVSQRPTLPPVVVDAVTALHLPPSTSSSAFYVSCVAGGGAGGNSTSNVAILNNGSASFPNIPSGHLVAPSLSNLSCCIDSPQQVAVVSRCVGVPLQVTSSPVNRMFVSAIPKSTYPGAGDTFADAVSLMGTVYCGSSLCVSFPSSNVSISAAAPFTTSSSSSSSTPSFVHTAGLEAGIADIAQLAFVSPQDIPADKAISITFTSSADPSLSSGSALLAVGEVPVLHSAVIDVYVGSPPEGLVPIKWLGAFAVFLAVDPSRLILRRAAQSYLAGLNVVGTRLEIAVGQPTTVVPQLLSSVALTDYVTSLTPSCQNQDQDIVLVKRHSQASSRCDSAAFSELAESSLHCEIIGGPDARCGCFVEIIHSLGSVCIGSDPLISVVCEHLGRCNDAKVISICSQVQANIPLQVFFVVGGTALVMLVLFACCRVRQAPKLATRVFVHQNPQHVLLAQRGKAEDVIFR